MKLLTAIFILITISAKGQMPIKTPKERGWTEAIVPTTEDMMAFRVGPGYVMEYQCPSIVGNDLSVIEIFKDDFGKMDWKHGEACFLLDEGHHWQYFPCKEYDKQRVKIILKWQKEHKSKK